MITDCLKNLSAEHLTFITAMLPISELRGAIPLGLSLGIPITKTYALSVLGNIVPVMPILLLLEPVSVRLRKFKVWSRFFDWLFERTKKRADVIQKYEILGLILFVSIPLPMTGAWTGAMAASLFKIRLRYAFIAICAGVLLAGLVVSSLCTLGIISWKAVTN